MYPDSIDELEQSAAGVWSFTDDNGDHVSTTYDRLGRVQSTTDQNNTSLGASQQRGVTHTYTYDTAGRLTLDAVTIPVASTGVDDSVLSVKTQYDDLGRVQKVTSCPNDDGTGTPVNEVQYAYDGWGKLSREWQSHAGAVVTGTTPSVQYFYEDGADGGVAKYVRLDQVTYPDGNRQIESNYAAGVDDIMSRLSSISDSSAGDLAQYTYLGLGTIVKESHPNVAGGLNLEYDPDEDNSFSGFDRFGRVVDQLWATDADTPIDEYKYGYDRAGNRAWKQNVAAVGKALDELYDYDDLNRLTNTQRGTLSFNPLSISPSKYQDWTLDGLGNFSVFNDNGTSQTRDVNGANEITSSTGIATPTYDVAGNMISDGTLKYEYDAWNRQVRVRRVSDDALWAEYQYDGANRRVEKAVTAIGGGVADVHYYYNANWQLLEERTTGVNAGVNQYIWDQSYIDAPLVRFHDGNGDGDVSDAGDSVRHFTWDANHNVTTTITSVVGSGVTTQHVVYDAYGQAAVYDSPWTNNLGAPNEDGPLYCGYIFNKETITYLARNRLFSMAYASWFTRDPIGYSGGINLYEYCGDDPLTRTDPRGLDFSMFCPSAYPKCSDYKYPPSPSQGNPQQGGFSPPPIPADPTQPPGPGWEWRPKGTPPGGPNGGWEGPGNQSLHPDLNHPPGKPPHWDWTDPVGNGWEYDPSTGQWSPKPGNKPNRPQPTFPPGTLKKVVVCTAGGITLTCVIYWVVSEGTRLFPLRNCVPIP